VNPDPTTGGTTAPDPTTPADLVLTERIRATPDQVFQYLVEPDKLIRWMGTEADLDPTPGGAFRINVTGQDIAAGTYVEVDRPHRVVFTWGWEGSPTVPPGSTTVAIALWADGDETVVELTHSGLPGGMDDEHRQGWTHYLDRLSRLTAGETLEPDPMEMRS
jgi:uncharacterized protein YndB with AHSA1/START domain